MAKTCTAGETSTRPVAGIFALFVKNLVIRLAGIEDKGSRSIHRSSKFAMLHNANLNILTLCLPICNRMAPPMLHQMYPLLEVEYDDEVSKMRPRVPYVERILSSETCRLMNQ